MKFDKYAGTGNDFILIDNRNFDFNKKDTQLIQLLCHRKLGIGADGLILLENDDEVDFKMIYFNADGSTGAMCGNGGRCIVDFAHQLGIISKKTTFRAADGLHRGEVFSDQTIQISLRDVSNIDVQSDYYFLDTGCPHYVTFVKNLDKINIKTEGRAIRYDKKFSPDGTNVNFVEINQNGLTVATYERGVENETQSCGTGVTASAIAYALAQKDTAHHQIAVKTKGGDLLVTFTKKEDRIQDIHLKAKVELVFQGYILGK